ncbi:arsenite efflux MFS transporter ArsK [Phyllobacterium myrsinacearum]|uniref:Putative MFS family arabinose efflux permease n=1 Tax=Phyllobacterium myrsinacearum TaxID=28101 RepID=A0A839EDF9_9HYPH|nr:arsenite efflux MFS transporter ArsK [Phyllobacterium myrsinacearum]MBA8876355.1 putative MFS family arabinose efflux permease [Phyllobacterium myrsinacearum]
MILSARRSLAAVTGLGVTQIVSYGTLYYSFSILEPAMAQEFGQSRQWLFAAFSGTLLVGGIISPWSGRWADRFGAGRVMTFGSLAAALSLILCVLSQKWIWFAPALVTTGMATPFILYNTAFAVLVQIDPQTASRRITYLTLIAGFSSTLFWPLATHLLTVFTWREIYLFYAGLQVFICFPIHFWLSQMTRRSPKLREDENADEAVRGVSGQLPLESRRSALLLIMAGFSLASFSLSAMLVHLVPVLAAVGVGTSAVLVGAIFGPSQFAARLVNMVFGNKLSAMAIAVLSTALIPLSFLMLIVPLPVPLVVGAVMFAMLFGMGSGLNSIVQGTLPLALFGHHGYGEILGKITSARLIVSSSAPFIFAFIMEKLGPKLALSVAAMVGVLGVLTFLTVASLVRRSTQ